MPTYQTTAQDEDTIRFGSAKIEVGTSSADLQDLGLVSGVAIKEDYTLVELKADNGAPITKGNKEHTVSLSFEMWELDLTKLALIRGGLDSTGSVAATPVTVTNEALTLTGTTAKKLAFKNGDGSEVGSIVVTDASSNAAVRNTDYVVSVDSAGYTTIARVAASTVIGTGEGVLVDYSYTPLANKTMSSGGLSTIAARYVRVTNINSAGKKFQIDIYKAKVVGGLDFSYPADDGDEPLKPKIEMKGEYDTTRTAGDQLFKITDEQGA